MPENVNRATRIWVELIPVTLPDIDVFFEHQIDQASLAMAAFFSRDRAAHGEHWQRILDEPANGKRTVLVDGEVAGNIVSFTNTGRREVGYWIGRAFWGNGVATAALSLYLEIELERPLYAGVAEANLGSRRVLEKNGFVHVDSEEWLDYATGQPITGLIYRLEH